MLIGLSVVSNNGSLQFWDVIPDVSPLQVAVLFVLFGICIGVCCIDLLFRVSMHWFPKSWLVSKHIQEEFQRAVEFQRPALRKIKMLWLRENHMAVLNGAKGECNVNYRCWVFTTLALTLIAALPYWVVLTATAATFLAALSFDHLDWLCKCDREKYVTTPLTAAICMGAAATGIFALSEWNKHGEPLNVSPVQAEIVLAGCSCAVVYVSLSYLEVLSFKCELSLTRSSSLALLLYASAAGPPFVANIIGGRISSGRIGIEEAVFLVVLLFFPFVGWLFHYSLLMFNIAQRKSALELACEEQASASNSWSSNSASDSVVQTRALPSDSLQPGQTGPRTRLLPGSQQHQLGGTKELQVQHMVQQLESVVGATAILGISLIPAFYHKNRFAALPLALRTWNAIFGLLVGAICGAVTQLIWKLLATMVQEAQHLDKDFLSNTDLSPPDMDLQTLQQRLRDLHHKLWRRTSSGNRGGTSGCQSQFDTAGGKALLMVLLIFNAVSMLAVFVIFSSSHAQFFTTHPGGVQVLVLSLLGAGLLACTAFRVSDVHEAHYAIVKRLDDYACEPTVYSLLTEEEDKHKAAVKRFTEKWLTKHMGLQCCEIDVNRNMFRHAMASLAIQTMLVIARQVIVPAVRKVHE
jgi:hypothetical protein